MAHLICNTNGKDSIAYVGQAPWHKLGQQLQPGQPIEIWLKESGMDYEVIAADVGYVTDAGSALFMPNKRVLYRSDTEAALSIVSKGYKIVQPGAIMKFFDDLCKIAGFDLEVAGVLDGGKRVWGLAKVSEGAPVRGTDIVKPYVLLATSYDGTMATVGQFTGVRVVCHNTITMAINDTVGQVRIPHNQQFDPEAMKQSLGIVENVYDKWMDKVKIMADTPMSEAAADKFMVDLMSTINKEKTALENRESNMYKHMMANFSGQGNLIGTDLDGGYNAWRMLNVVTQLVDHERGVEKSRLNSAWFGSGNALKNKAFELLSEVAA